MKIKTAAVFLCLAVNLTLSVCAETEGERLFKRNDPAAAAPLLEQDIRNGAVSSVTYNFLGLSYYQIGEYEKAVNAFERGMNSPAANKRVLAFNAGNAAFAAKDYESAERFFSLALTASPSFSPALLNRANTRLSAGNLDGAVEDYGAYLLAVPDSPQAGSVGTLVTYLEEEITRRAEEAARIAEERRRVEEENARLQEEIARQEAEKAAQEELARQAEEERRRKLLEEVAASLQQTDSANVTSGAADVLDYDYESELE